MKLGIVGAGWAGLAAAVQAAQAGHQVTVFESARTAGGRARSVLHGDALALDNGQHILLGAYAESLRMLRQVGVDPDAALLRQFELTAAQQQLFHSVVVHFENDVPIQVEDRYVNPAVAPDYMAQDFGRQTPNAYLTRVAPLQGVQYAIEASMPGPEVAELLRMEITEPCLVLRRCTRSQGQVASVSALWHPASRYQFT
ncbi:MAG: FAD-dependent oxidoreductase, partial [Comamonas sp.]